MIRQLYNKQHNLFSTLEFELREREREEITLRVFVVSKIYKHAFRRVFCCAYCKCKKQ